MATRKEKPKTWSRKGRCPSCGVGFGSKHKEDCKFEYAKSENDILTERVIESNLPVPVQPIRKEVVMEGDPEAQLAYATKAANALMGVVKKKPNPVMISGKQYLEYGDWQVLARFYGATVEIEWTKQILNDAGKIKGYEARALVKRNGEIISSAEGMTTTDEKRWADAEEYAVRSMAQTRTAAKALRNAFGWVAELAGYASTPLEEMDGVQRDSAPKSTYKPYTVAPSPDARKTQIVEYLKHLGWNLISKKEYEDKVKELTGLELVEENYIAIADKLRALIEASDPIAAFENIIQDKGKDIG